jgi:hypothetical protein
LDDLYDKGWDVLNHSFTHNARWLSAMTATDYINEITKNLPETRNKTRNHIEMPAFVVPSGDNYYQDIAYQQGQKIVFDQTANSTGIGGLNVANDINFYGQVIHRSEADNQINTSANQIGTVANRAAAGERIWYNEFTHHIDNFGGSAGLNFNTFRSHVERIANSWGKTGTDRMWMAPLQEVLEYLTTRQTATYTASLNGNQLIIDLNMQNVPTWLRRRPMTLVVNSNVNFSRVDVSQGVQMTFNGSGNKKIINLDLSGASAVVTNVCDNDVTPPTINNCPQNVNLTTTTGNAQAFWTAPTATDNCTTPSLSSNYASGTTFSVGTTAVTYTATDAKGNRSFCNFNVNVTQAVTNPCANDVTPPVFANCPQNINLTTTTGNAQAFWTAPTATDNCTTPSVSGNYASGSSFPIGSMPVIYTATDGKGNKAYCTFTVNVTQPVVNNCANDVTPPVFQTCPQNVNVTTTTYSATASWTTPIVTDDCAATPSLSSNYANGATYPVGTTNIIYAATDDKYNRTTACSFNVIVTRVSTGNGSCNNDATPPVFRNCPANIALTTTTSEAIAYWTAPTATDNCTASPTISSNFVSGHPFPIGATTVTYAATDAKNNRATCNFVVTVQSLIIGEICASKSDVPWHEWISKVQFNTINNVSEKTRNDRFIVGYSDWRDQTTGVNQNKTYPLSILASESYSVGTAMLFYRAWIDFNGNGFFDTNEKVLEQTNNGKILTVQNVKIPLTTTLGAVRMRITMKKGSYPAPCENFSNGEVEDYTVVINGQYSPANLVQLRPTQLIPIVINNISPNPTSSDVFIKLESLDSRTVRFDFQNALGTRVRSESRLLEKGVNTIGFDLNEMPQGVYFIETDVAKGRNVPVKFVKM